MIDEELEQDELEQDEQQLYEHHRITVDRGQEMLRVDKYLQMRLSGVSRNKIQEALKVDCIRVNGQPVKANYRVKPLDEVTVLLPTPPHEFELIPEEMPLDIVYEDDAVLVLEKPAGLVVHPAVGNWTGTLVNGLYHYLGFSPFLVHRIDKDTSGLMMVTNTEQAQTAMARQFYDHTIERKYNALVWGDFPEDDGTITGNLGRSPKDRRMMCVYPHDDLLSEEEQPGKHAVTHWHVLERFGYVTLVECILETGRTHQIRAHMRHIGHPLFSDALYGGDAILKGTTFTRYKQFVENCFAVCPRQALHARVLGFDHPVSGDHMHFESPIPSDMQQCINKWRDYTNNH